MRSRKYSPLLLELLAICLAMLILIPFFMIFINSFKDIRESALFGLSLPSNWVFSNYEEVFNQDNLLRGFKNSFLLSALVVVSVNFSLRWLHSSSSGAAGSFCKASILPSLWG